MKITQLLCTLSLMATSTGAFSGWKSGTPIVDDSYFAPQETISEYDAWEDVSLKKEKKLEKLEAQEARRLKTKQKINEKYDTLSKKYDWRKNIDFIPQEIKSMPENPTAEDKKNLAFAQAYYQIKQQIAQLEKELENLKVQYMKKLPESDQERFIMGVKLGIPGMFINTGTSEEQKTNETLREKYEIIDRYRKKALLIQKSLEELKEKQNAFKEFFVQIPKQNKKLKDEITLIQKQRAKLEGQNR